MQIQAYLPFLFYLGTSALVACGALGVRRIADVEPSIVLRLFGMSVIWPVVAFFRLGKMLKGHQPVEKTAPPKTTLSCAHLGPELTQKLVGKRKLNSSTKRFIREHWAHHFGMQCACCGVEMTLPVTGDPADNWATIDHIVPISNGGGHEPWNLRVICFSCNAQKADQMPSLAFV